MDKALQHLMEHGHLVEGGDRLAKTILFARNHQHAKFIEDRFNHHYPHYEGHFARIIDHYATYPQSLLDDFSQKNKPPHIAISVDMLDTGNSHTRKATPGPSRNAASGSWKSPCCWRRRARSPQ